MSAQIRVRGVRHPLPPLSKTDRELLGVLDTAVGYVPGEKPEDPDVRDVYVRIRHTLERRLRALCRLADDGYRARYVLQKEARRSKETA